MEWTSNAIDQLRALWAEGLSTAEIGRRMGVTKNAIVGKAHRLDLPARPSPIRKETLGGIPAAPRSKPAAREAPQAARRVVAQAPAAAAPSVAAAVHPFPRPPSLRSCCWPIGEPGTRDFRFCSAEADPGKPYCAAHVAVAYVRVTRDRRSDAA